MKKLQGSYTVEAALVMPLVMFTILFVMQQAIGMYTKSAEIMKREEWWEAYRPAQEFHKYNSGGIQDGDNL